MCHLWHQLFPAIFAGRGHESTHLRQKMIFSGDDKWSKCHFRVESEWVHQMVCFAGNVYIHIYTQLQIKCIPSLIISIASHHSPSFSTSSWKQLKLQTGVRRLQSIRLWLCIDSVEINPSVSRFRWRANRQTARRETNKIVRNSIQSAMPCGVRVHCVCSHISTSFQLFAASLDHGRRAVQAWLWHGSHHTHTHARASRRTDMHGA